MQLESQFLKDSFELLLGITGIVAIEFYLIE